jgi:hypothetical protein
MVQILIFCEDQPTKPDNISENSAPIIQEIIKDQSKIRPNQWIVLTAIASDPDSDGLSYQWLSSSGSFDSYDSLQNKVRWKSPDISGIYTITCEVSDGKLSVSKQIIVGTNTPPVIYTIRWEPSEVGWEEWITITVQANDADSDTLYYKWTASSGTFDQYDQMSNQILWLSPSISGVCNISCIVSDGRDEYIKTVDISVIQLYNMAKELSEGNIFYYVVKDNGSVDYYYVEEVIGEATYSNKLYKKIKNIPLNEPGLNVSYLYERSDSLKLFKLNNNFQGETVVFDLTWPVGYNNVIRNEADIVFDRSTQVIQIAWWWEIPEYQIFGSTSHTYAKYFGEILFRDAVYSTGTFIWEIELIGAKINNWVFGDTLIY